MDGVEDIVHLVPIHHQCIASQSKHQIFIILLLFRVGDGAADERETAANKLLDFLQWHFDRLVSARVNIFERPHRPPCPDPIVMGMMIVRRRALQTRLSMSGWTMQLCSRG